MSEPMRTISLKLPKALDRALTELAERRQTTRSTLLREAIEELTQQGQMTIGQRAGDLLGSLEGPEDLSTSPEHLRGFGE